MTQGITAHRNFNDTTEPDSPHALSIRKVLADTVSDEELNGLCFDLQIQTAEIAGETLAERQRNVILWLHRHGRPFALWQWLRKNRPNAFD